MATYFISDLHLDANSSKQSALLLNFLHTHGGTADAVYILGDLFAIWLETDLEAAYVQDLVQALRDLAAKKVPIYFMRGNRDFLISEQFCRAAGCKLLPDPHKINLYGQDVLLTHGDMLCTADYSYQRFRKIVQNPVLTYIFLCLPVGLRKRLGMWIKGTANRSPKSAAVYDAEQTTINKWFSKFAVQTMIHGHTHMPAIHQVNNTTRIVLGDWNKYSAKILVVDQHGYALQDLVAAE